jgi:hypothetical protein
MFDRSRFRGTGSRGSGMPVGFRTELPPRLECSRWSARFMTYPRYPVVPWVLSDYTSESLDLTNRNS